MSAQITIKVNAKKVPDYIQKSVERQRIIKSYLKGEINSEQLKEYGIQFTNPFPDRKTI
jgi:hypothetical protein